MKIAGECEDCQKNGDNQLVWKYHTCDFVDDFDHKTCSDMCNPSTVPYNSDNLEMYDYRDSDYWCIDCDGLNVYPHLRDAMTLLECEECKKIMPHVKVTFDVFPDDKIEEWMCVHSISWRN